MGLWEQLLKSHAEGSIMAIISGTVR